MSDYIDNDKMHEGMNKTYQEKRSKWVKYISAGVRYALEETGKKHFPDSTLLIVFNGYHDLAQFDQIIGFNILISNISSSYDFCLAFDVEEVSDYKLLKAFDEFIQLNSVEDYENEH